MPRAAARPVLILLAVAALAAGCGKQGEGEPCNSKNNNDDCADGLTCRKSSPQQDWEVCCSDNSTNPACVGAPGVGTSSTSTGQAGGGGTGGKGGAGGGGTGGKGGAGGR